MKTGALTNVGQHDWVVVSLTANRAYEFTITGLSQYAFVELGTADGLSGVGTSAVAVSSTSAGLGSPATQYMYFMPATSGTYYIDLSDSFGATPESYTVSGVTTTADFTDNPTHPGVLTIGGKFPPPVTSDFNGDVAEYERSGQRLGNERHHRARRQHSRQPRSHLARVSRLRLSRVAR